MATKYTKIPLDSENAFYVFSITLSGVNYAFHMRWNSRAGRWFLDIHSASDVPIISSIPLLIRRNLIGRYAMATKPPGTLYVNDDTAQESEPGRNAWGTTHTLYYAENV